MVSQWSPSACLLSSQGLFSVFQPILTMLWFEWFLFFRLILIYTYFSKFFFLFLLGGGLSSSPTTIGIAVTLIFFFTLFCHRKSKIHLTSSFFFFFGNSRLFWSEFGDRFACQNLTAQLSWAVEYADCISAEGKISLQTSVLDVTWNCVWFETLVLDLFQMWNIPSLPLLSG